jgi:hypothetical protein
MTDEREDLNPLDPSVLETPQLPAPLPASSSSREDFEFARKNVLETIENGNVSLEQLARVAFSSQNPRAYEVLAKMIQVMIEANARLLDLQIKIRELDDADGTPEKKGTVTNNLFVGSTAELGQLIKDMRKKGQEQDG